MSTKTFSGGRIRKAEYDPASQQLDLLFDNKTILAYKQVPAEVFRRLCSAPSPATYWEDRIAEEYPKGIPTMVKPAAGSDEPKKLNDLFGGDAQE
ncbi:MAG: KTSC domain-containing protein [Pseudomonadota bacterium]